MHRTASETLQSLLEEISPTPWQTKSQDALALLGNLWSLLNGAGFARLESLTTTVKVSRLIKRDDLPASVTITAGPGGLEVSYRLDWRVGNQVHPGFSEPEAVPLVWNRNAARFEGTEVLPDGANEPAIDAAMRAFAKTYRAMEDHIARLAAELEAAKAAA